MCVSWVTLLLSLGQLNNQSLFSILPVYRIGTYFLNLYFNMMVVVDFFAQLFTNPEKSSSVITYKKMVFTRVFIYKNRFL